MWRLPFISREHHESVLKERDRIIAELHAEVARMDKRAETPIAVTVKLPDDFAVLAPAFVRPTRGKRDVKPENSMPLESIKWHEVNEEDPDAIAKIILAENGGRLLAPQILAQATARVQRRIRQAKVHQTLRQMEVGTMDARVPPSVRVEEQPVEIPDEIRERIEMADRGI